GAVKRARSRAEPAIEAIGLEVAPQQAVRLLPDLQVDPARGRRLVAGRTVVAIGRIHVLGIKAAQYVARVLLVEAAEDLVDRPLAGIQRRGEAVAAGGAALDVEGDAAVDIGLLIVRRGLDQIVVEAATEGQVADPDIEPFAFRDTDLAGQVALPPARGAGDGNVVIPRRKDAADDELSGTIDRDGFAHHAHFRSGREAVARGGDHPAMHRDATPR